VSVLLSVIVLGAIAFGLLGCELQSTRQKYLPMSRTF
jgi:hypothetical protein